MRRMTAEEYLEHTGSDPKCECGHGGVDHCLYDECCHFDVSEGEFGGPCVHSNEPCKCLAYRPVVPEDRVSPFQALANECDSEISKAILGESLTLPGPNTNRHEPEDRAE